MLDNFTIKNFRGIKELTLPKLSRVNLFVGKNGVGKTSVLEALQLYQSQCDSSVAWWFLSRRCEDVIIANNVELFAKLFTNGTEPLYLGPSESPTEVRTNIGQASGNLRLARRTENGGGSDTGIPIAGVPPRNSRRLPLRQVFVPSTMIGNTFFSELWGEVELTGKDDRVVEIVRLLEPGLERITTRKFADRTGLAPIARVRGTDGPVPLARLGEGVSRIASLALALVCAEGGMLLIDEFENGLHYSVQGQVWDFLLKLSAELNVQVFATTHSRDAVYALAEASNEDDHMVYRLNKDGDEIGAKAFDRRYLEFAVEEELEIR